MFHLAILECLKNFANRNNTAAISAMRKLAVSLADSVDLRVILSVLYIITEVMREEAINFETSIYKDNIESFKEELGELIERGG